MEWLYDLNLQDENDYRTLKLIYETHEGERKYLITEVIEIINSESSIVWDKDLNAEAKASFLSLIGGQGGINWTNEGNAQIGVTEDSPILAAYKYYEIPVEKIKKALETKSW